tara:strand:- start:274 stop:1674 length:1401 start_codon:yes stop_codon:yes gene_type:complete
MENLRIGICGNIGVGKSTLVEAATKSPLDEILLNEFPSRDHQEKVYSFPENFNEEVLDAFYQDPIANAFTAQIEFFNGRLDRQKEIEQCYGVVLEDRTLLEDYHIFGKAQKILGNMNNAEFLAYQRTYNLMTDKIPSPHLMVYLRADVPTLLQRIQHRGRESERSIEPSYLQQLNNLYEEFIERYASCPVLVIDANEEGNINDYLEKTVRKIANKINSLDLRVTTPGIKEWVTLPQTKATVQAIDAERRLEEYLQKNPRLITIAGNLGLGKSTLTKIMERSLNSTGLYEIPKENPLLEKFLADKPTHCYDLQMHFLKMRSELRKKGKSNDGSYIKDRSLPEDVLVFCHLFHRDGYLTSNELDNLTNEFRIASNNLPPADLMVVLQGTPELSWRRIQQRGREMEIQGGWKYNEIKALHELYKSYPQDVRKFGFHNGPLLEINVNKLDITNRVHVGYIFEQVYEKLNK